LIFYSGTKNASSWSFRAWLALKEAGLAFPRKAGELPAWEFAWERKRADAEPAANAAAPASATPGIAGAVATPSIATAEPVSGPASVIAAMLRAHPESIDAIAARLGFQAGWSSSEPAAAAANAVDPGTRAGAAPTAATAGPTLPAATSAAPAHPAAELLTAHPESVRALAALVAPSGP